MTAIPREHPRWFQTVAYPAGHFAQLLAFLTNKLPGYYRESLWVSLFLVNSKNKMRRLLKISCRTEAQSSRLSIAKVMTFWRARRADSVRITVYTTFIMADSARKLVRAAWKEARKASIALRLLLFTTQARPQSLKMASTSDNSSDSNAIPLTENDISGASLLGRKLRT